MLLFRVIINMLPNVPSSFLLQDCARIEAIYPELFLTTFDFWASLLKISKYQNLSQETKFPFLVAVNDQTFLSLLKLNQNEKCA